MGEFNAYNFWEADERLKKIVASYNESEWRRDPGLQGLDQSSYVRMWSEYSTVTEYYDPEEAAEFDKIQEMKEQEYAFINSSSRLVSVLGIIALIVILIIGIFGGDILIKLAS